MKIYYNDTYTEVIPSDSSYRYQEIMGDSLISLEFKLPYFIDFPVGSTINYQNREFKMYELGHFTKENDREYSYVLAFHTEQKSLERYKFRNHIDRRLKFTLTAKPAEYIEHICKNLKERTGLDWQVGECLECSERTQSFSHNSILDALNSIASLFETEWEIRDTTIHLRKVEYNKETPLTMSYGRGNGFKSGIQRTLSGEMPVDVLFCEGGNRNIDQSKYVYYKTDENGNEQKHHADTLRLPKSERFFYVPPTESAVEKPDSKDYGTLMSWSEFFALESEKRERILKVCECYITDEDGYELRRAEYNGEDMVESFINNGYEESSDFTEIYPKRVGTISEVITIDKEKHFYNFRDKDCDVDYSDKTTWESGAQVTIIFQDGMLEGKEFNLSKYTHVLNGREVREFEIQPAEIDAITMPDEETHYMPEVDKHYAIFHVNLPQKYITSAEREMALQGCFYMHKHKESEIEFQGSVDGIWAKQNWVEIGPRIGLGYYINFTDNAICKDGKLMRITAVKDNINRPHSPELTLSNTTIAQGLSSQLKKIPQNQVYATSKVDEAVNFTKRNFRDQKETIEALNVAFEGQYQDGINPATVRAMALMIGDESLQYEFGNVEGETEEGYVSDFRTYLFEPYFSNDRLIVGTDRVMRHLCYAYMEIVKDGEVETMVANMPYWNIRGAGEMDKIGHFSIPKEESDTLYYLYVKVSKNALKKENIGKVDDSGNCFILSKTPMALESEEWLHLLVGILNREFNGTRSFASVYGSTEILGNRITSGVVKSRSGKTYIDLDNDIVSGRFNFKDGLISGRIWVGDDEETAVAGMGGDNLLFAGKNGDSYLFNITKEGNLFYYNEEGDRMFYLDKGGVVGFDTMFGKDLQLTTALTLGYRGGHYTTIDDNGILTHQLMLRTNKWTGGGLTNRVPVPVWSGYLKFGSDNWTQTEVDRATSSNIAFQFTIDRLGEGYCIIKFNRPWSNDFDYFVQAYGLSRGDDTRNPKSSYICILKNQDKNGFTLVISDDESPNDYDFFMTIWSR